MAVKNTWHDWWNVIRENDSQISKLWYPSSDNDLSLIFYWTTAVLPWGWAAHQQNTSLICMLRGMQRKIFISRMGWYQILAFQKGGKHKIHISNWDVNFWGIKPAEYFNWIATSIQIFIFHFMTPLKHIFYKINSK